MCRNKAKLHYQLSNNTTLTKTKPQALVGYQPTVLATCSSQDLLCNSTIQASASGHLCGSAKPEMMEHALQLEFLAPDFPPSLFPSSSLVFWLGLSVQQLQAALSCPCCNSCSTLLQLHSNKQLRAVAQSSNHYLCFEP
jgi:thymidine kinase